LKAFLRKPFPKKRDSWSTEVLGRDGALQLCRQLPTAPFLQQPSAKTGSFPLISAIWFLFGCQRQSPSLSLHAAPLLVGVKVTTKFYFMPFQIQ